MVGCLTCGIFIGTLISSPVTTPIAVVGIVGGASVVFVGRMLVGADEVTRHDVPQPAEGAALVDQDQVNNDALHAQEERHRAEMEALEQRIDARLLGTQQGIDMSNAQLASMRSEMSSGFDRIERLNRSGPAQAGLFAEGARRRGMRRDTAGSNPAANDAADADEPVHAAMP